MVSVGDRGVRIRIDEYSVLAVLDDPGGSPRQRAAAAADPRGTKIATARYHRQQPGAKRVRRRLPGRRTGCPILICGRTTDARSSSDLKVRGGKKLLVGCWGVGRSARIPCCSHLLATVRTSGLSRGGTVQLARTMPQLLSVEVLGRCDTMWRCTFSGDPRKNGWPHRAAMPNICCDLCGAQYQWAACEIVTSAFVQSSSHRYRHLSYLRQRSTTSSRCVRRSRRGRAKLGSA